MIRSLGSKIVHKVVLFFAKLIKKKSKSDEKKRVEKRRRSSRKSRKASANRNESEYEESAKDAVIDISKESGEETNTQDEGEGEDGEGEGEGEGEEGEGDKRKRRSTLAKLETYVASLFRRLLESNIPIHDVLTFMTIGYVVGFIITIIWYNCVTEKELNVARWVFFTIFGFIALLMGHSKEVRCTITLAIPILCSSRGRSLIVALAFFFAVSGPTANMFKNIDVMTSSITCGQMQLKQALSDMLDTLKVPLVAIKEAILVAIKELKNVMKKVQLVLYHIQELIIILLASIKNAFDWLRNIVSMCNKEFGTPFERCMNTANDAMISCREKLGPLKALCHLTKLFSMFCYAAKIVDVICVLIDFVDDAIIGVVMNKLKEFANEVKRLFDVSITFDHDFYFKTTSSKELSQIRDDIMKDIRKHMQTFILIFGWLDILSVLLMCLVLFKAIWFRMKYVRNPSYQNNFITIEFVQIDEKRREQEKERALPLTLWESFKYPKLSDCRLTRVELTQMAKSAVFLTISTTQLFCICLSDFSLFWVLALISFFGLRQRGFEPPPYITVQVNGSGFVGEIFRGIVGAFEPMSQNYTVDTKTCLPLPYEPNFTTYYLIASLCCLAWIFLLCQPYGLRLRHAIMRLYYPDVARERAVWLYDKILLNRMTFFKLARRKARLLFVSDKTVDDFSWMDWIRARTEKYWWCRLILGRSKSEKCLLCGTPLKADTRVKCESLGCKALYCKTCFEGSENICCICHNPMEYGDLSDLSEIKDSSDDPDVLHIDETEKDCVFAKVKRTGEAEKGEKTISDGGRGKAKKGFSSKLGNISRIFPRACWKSKDEESKTHAVIEMPKTSEENSDIERSDVEIDKTKRRSTAKEAEETRRKSSIKKYGKDSVDSDTKEEKSKRRSSGKKIDKSPTEADTEEGKPKRRSSRKNVEKDSGDADTEQEKPKRRWSRKKVDKDPVDSDIEEEKPKRRSSGKKVDKDSIDVDTEEEKPKHRWSRKKVDKKPPDSDTEEEKPKPRSSGKKIDKDSIDADAEQEELKRRWGRKKVDKDPVDSDIEEEKSSGEKIEKDPMDADTEKKKMPKRRWSGRRVHKKSFGSDTEEEKPKRRSGEKGVDKEPTDSNTEEEKPKRRSSGKKIDEGSTDSTKD
ncbi:DC-STAMP domain-containing protein 2-like [Glossina fuscipes]|uniref:DC-STAMP domain-containing protein 2-like n=1 Tax=Glossina fuscipes TaxID=7396 RepID=A0A9C6E258_9MUSC|nr:DC-STAMP domain-containing protein 2-like [Glossina fuscipes]